MTAQVELELILGSRTYDEGFVTPMLGTPCRTGCSRSLASRFAQSDEMETRKQAQFSGIHVPDRTFLNTTHRETQAGQLRLHQRPGSSWFVERRSTKKLSFMRIGPFEQTETSLGAIKLFVF